MSLTITPFQNHQGYLYVKAFAVLDKTDGAFRRHQKTWKVRTVAPNLAAVEMRHAFEAMANRWQQQILTK